MRALEKNINWAKVEGLIPAIVKTASGEVLMLGYMNKTALSKTIESSYVTFYSRTRQTLWTKGETSGHSLKMINIFLDCDKDSLLVIAEPMGPTCHNGSSSCFKGESSPNFIFQLETIIDDRFQRRPPNSYITTLAAKGTHKMAQKVGEEGVEVALAAKDDDLNAFKNEVADLFFHTLILMRKKNVSFDEISQILAKRHNERNP